MPHTSAFLNDMRSISSMVGRELQEFTSEVANMHMRWLEEIEQEASRMFSGEVSTEPDLMPKTPSQKSRARRKRVSIAQQEEQPRRTRRGKRSSAKLELVFEEEGQPLASTSSSDAALQTDLLDDNAANQSQPGMETTVVEEVLALTRDIQIYCKYRNTVTSKSLEFKMYLIKCNSICVKCT